MNTAAGEEYYPGLEGVISNETAIANIEGKEGQGGLEYRGYQIEELAGHVSYEETAYLLLHGDLPNRAQLDEFRGRLRAMRAVPAPLLDLLGTIPRPIHPMDALRTSVSVLSHFDPDVNAPPSDHAANVRKAERMLAQMPTAIAARERIADGKQPIGPRDDLDFPANFLYMVTGKVPTETERQAFDVSLVLYTEHELNASTFSARVTVSTLSDIYSGVVAAIGTLKGPLHGGANEEAWKLVEAGRRAREGRAVDQGRAGPQGADHGLRPPRLQDGRPPGADPEGILRRARGRAGRRPLGARSPSRSNGPSPSRRSCRPNVDWPSARLYHYLGLRARRLHADLRDGARRRLGGPHHRAARPQSTDAAAGPLRRPADADRVADRSAPLIGQSGQYVEAEARPVLIPAGPPLFA